MQWANLYERVFAAYGAPLRESQRDLGWLGVAERFSTVAGGAFVRAQTRSADSTSGVDGDMFGEIIVDLLAVEPGNIENRRLQQSATAT